MGLKLVVVVVVVQTLPPLYPADYEVRQGSGGGFVDYLCGPLGQDKAHERDLAARKGQGDEHRGVTTMKVGDSLS